MRNRRPPPLAAGNAACLRPCRLERAPARSALRLDEASLEENLVGPLLRHGLQGAGRKPHAHGAIQLGDENRPPLEVDLELSLRDAGRLDTDAALVLGETPARDTVPDSGSLAGHLAYSTHGAISVSYALDLDPSFYRMSPRDAKFSARERRAQRSTNTQQTL